MIFFPLHDDNSEGYKSFRGHFINNGLIFFLSLVFAYEVFLLSRYGHGSLFLFIHANTFNPASSLGAGFLKLTPLERIPVLFKDLYHLQNADLINILKSTFLHSSLFHLLSNIFVLWMLGDNVEYAMGHLRYFFFFLLTAILSQFGEVIFSTKENFIASIGASGAIMAVAGAYLVYFSKARINFFYAIFWFWWGIVDFPARVVLFIYFVLQLSDACYEYGTDYGMVAAWCHVFGFTSGALLSLFLRYTRDEKYFLYNRAKPIRYKKSIFRPQDNEPDPWGRAL
jgi:membrane associated rhomboid family serine protease